MRSINYAGIMALLLFMGIGFLLSDPANAARSVCFRNYVTNVQKTVYLSASDLDAARDLIACIKSQVGIRGSSGSSPSKTQIENQMTQEDKQKLEGFAKELKDAYQKDKRKPTNENTVKKLEAFVNDKAQKINP